MNRDLVTDIGENYEYIRTIIKNKIELQKLEMVESAGKMASAAVLAIVLFTLLFFILIALLSILAIWLIRMTESEILGISIVAALLILVTTLIYINRQAFIIRPLLNKFHQMTMDIIKKDK